MQSFKEQQTGQKQKWEDNMNNMEMVRILKPMIEDVNKIIAPKLVEAFNAGYELRKKEEK
jgi:hypothetical protein